VSNSVGFATEFTEMTEFFLNGLGVLCGKVIISPSFWTLPTGIVMDLSIAIPV
jgi:hypothetical protein